MRIRSFVQIHYHDRLCGVRQVMGAYSETFRRMAGDEAPNYRLCHACESAGNTFSSVIDMPGVDYHTCRTAHSYRRNEGRLFRRLKTILTSLPLEFPAAVVGHNLNLGKNPALSSAFTECARQLGTGGRYAFFMVMHDFVEQGRSDLNAALQRLSTEGINCIPTLYAEGAPVHFIVTAAPAAGVTGLEKKYQTILPHPVRAERTVSEAGERSIREQLCRLAGRDGCFFDPERTLFYYPSRIIYRKNVFEAFLFATVLNEGSLITGSPGATTADRRRMRELRKLAVRYRRSFVSDPLRIRFVQDALKDKRGTHPSALLYGGVDGVISTSVAEGYGYSLFEPWCYTTPVVGRFPDGTGFFKGMNVEFLYRRLPVPVSMIHLPTMYRNYAESYVGMFGKKYVSMKRFASVAIRDGCVDFGRVGERQQIRLITRFLENERVLEQFRTLLREKREGWPGIDAVTTVGKTTERTNGEALRNWSSSGFDASFVKCFNRIPCRAEPVYWYRKIGRFFRRYGNFHPLAPAR